MFACTPVDISRIIFYRTVAARNENLKRAIVDTFTNAVALPNTKTFTNVVDLPNTKTSVEYRVPVFENAKDVAHVRMSMSEHTDIDSYRSRNYTVFIDIKTSTGTEEYCMHLVKYLNANDLVAVSLSIMESLEIRNKYTDLVADAFRSVYPDGLVDKFFVCGQDVLMGYHEHTDTYEFFEDYDIDVFV
jgi:hypothetical protein